ncbi:hypothetical protein [Pseudonocardia sp. NPDC049154]|uniref:hypothetical protein n=1 Tax=Pseudonocardia sp. NPDC049154 TaxID=3155501 RepID=UPI0033E0575F
MAEHEQPGEGHEHKDEFREMGSDPGAARRVPGEDRLVIVFLSGRMQEHSLNSVHDEAAEQ